MKNKKRYDVLLLLLLSLFLGACTKKSEPVHLTQVFDNNTFQTRGDYSFEKNQLTINKEFTLSKNLNVLPNEIDVEKNKQEIKKMIQGEFPQKVVKDELLQSFENTLSKIKVKKNDQRIIFTGKNYQKRFDYLDDSKKMVKDELGIEYSVDNQE